MATHENKYTVAGRLSQLENAVTELRKENKELRTHLVGALQTAVNDAKNLIQSSIRVPLDGAPGKDGVAGAQGPEGAAGNVLFIGPNEVQAQVQILRQQLVKWQSAIQFAYEQNKGTKHRGLQSAINNVLKAIEKNAQ